ncbi:DUF397 domain-containing protein [Streptomyces sp. NPDC044984]|uniref:DUF397 domain-containing protein n=1 Tax=Streptomyces sp. NPDC044984 TaxID=3154335 RepID=UPI0034084F9A
MNRKGTGRDDVEPTRFRSGCGDSGNPSDCVEVAMTPDSVHVRDSRTTDAAPVSPSRRRRGPAS